MKKEPYSPLNSMSLHLPQHADASTLVIDSSTQLVYENRHKSRASRLSNHSTLPNTPR